MNFTRYAIYYAPPFDADWARFGAAWLGWDMEAGAQVAHPDISGLDVSAITEAPRRYGLHATLKPPFRLAAGQSPSALQQACAALSATRSPVSVNGLEIGHLGRFLALLPRGNTDGLNALAAACVTELDKFRAPLSQSELDRRRAKGLPPTQEQNLMTWGYPYVLDQFRFHITLTGRLDKSTLAKAMNLLQERLGPLLPEPFVIRDLALVGEDEEGRFHLIRRFTLGG